MSIDLFAQGTVNFSNLGGCPITNALTMQRAVSGTTFLVQLYWFPYSCCPTPPNDSSMMSVGANTGIRSDMPGFFDAGTITIPGVTPPGWFCWLQVRVWESAYGATFEEAETNQTQVVPGRLALLCKSGVFLVTTGDPTTNPPTIPASLVPGLGCIVLRVNPPFAITSVTKAGNVVTLTWHSAPGRTYRVQWTSVLATGNGWTDLSGDVLADGDTASKDDSTFGSSSQRLYRVALLF